MFYQQEAWFALLQEARSRMQLKDMAVALGVSAPLLSQVFNGSGKYGNGECSTQRLADRVLHTFGQYACPHLSAQSGSGEQVVITAAQCRGYAHRAAPTGSPRDMQHWQACNGCAHKPHSAPALARESKPRGPRGKSEAAASTTSSLAPEALS